MIRLVAKLTLIASLICAACRDDPFAGTELTLQVQGYVYDTSGEPIPGAEVFLFSGSFWTSGSEQTRKRTSSDGYYLIRLAGACGDPTMTVRVWDEGTGMREVNTVDNPGAFSRQVVCTSDVQEIDVTI